MSPNNKRSAARWPLLPGSPFAPVGRRILGWSPLQLAAIRDEGESVELELGALLSEGAESGDDEVQSAIAAWAEHVGRFVPTSDDLLLGLGRHLVAEPALRERYDAIEPGLAAFMCEAIRIHCERASGRLRTYGVRRSLP